MVLKLNAALFAVLVSAGAAAAQSFVFCTDQAPEGFDPARYVSMATFDGSSRTIYNRLVEFVPGTVDVQPGLAESWEVSENGTVYTFRLRPNVAFHSNDAFAPSRDLAAEDVVFSFERQRLLDHPFHYVGPGDWTYFRGMGMGARIASIEAVDALTVRFVLTDADAGFPSKLAMDFASILSAEYGAAMAAAGTPEQIAMAPIGTGPFVYSESQNGTEVRFQTNDDYWNGAPAIDDLTVSVIEDPAARFEALRSGDCHAMARPQTTDLPKFEAAEEVAVISVNGQALSYLAFNTTLAPFDNANVRRALSLAVDRETLVESIFGLTADVAIHPAASPDLAPDAEVYDVEAARRLLAEEGVEDLAMTLWMAPVARPYNPDPVGTARRIADDLAAVGVDVAIARYDWTDFLRRSRAPDRDGAVLFGWINENGDPDGTLGELLTCDTVGKGNRAQWCNGAFDGLLDQARTTSDPETRAALFDEAQAIFAAEAPWVILARSVRFAGVRAEVEGLVVDPFGGHRFEALRFLN
ncbi:MAG: ABC transporter substrate-binding protein [Pseudomonadota bacterium]